MAYELLGKGANINQVDKAGSFALKEACIRTNQPEIEKLVQHGADINKRDHKNRNILHFAINQSSASSDATFEMEQLIISLGVDINCVDKRLRTPLHYAFVKIGNWSINS